MLFVIAKWDSLADFNMGKSRPLLRHVTVLSTHKLHTLSLEDNTIEVSDIKLPMGTS